MGLTTGVVNTKTADILTQSISQSYFHATLLNLRGMQKKEASAEFTSTGHEQTPAYSSDWRVVVQVSHVSSGESVSASRHKGRADGCSSTKVGLSLVSS